MLNEELKRDIKTVVDYLWRDEKHHNMEWGYPKHHIFRVLKRLAKAIRDES